MHGRADPRFVRGCGRRCARRGRRTRSEQDAARRDGEAGNRGKPVALHGPHCKRIVRSIARILGNDGWHVQAEILYCAHEVTELLRSVVRSADELRAQPRNLGRYRLNQAPHGIDGVLHAAVTQHRPMLLELLLVPPAACDCLCLAVEAALSDPEGLRSKVPLRFLRKSARTPATAPQLEVPAW